MIGVVRILGAAVAASLVVKLLAALISWPVIAGLVVLFGLACVLLLAIQGRP